MAEPLEIIIFDADGTILDTREFIYQAFEQTFKQHGHEVPSRETLLAHMGKPLAEMYDVLANEMDADIEQLIEHHKALHKGALMPLVAAYEGLHDLLESIHARGMKVGVCTNRDSHAKTLFEQIGILKDVDIFITSDDVQEPKPDPEGIRKILAAAAIAPEHAVMVGDTEVDIGAGRNAQLAYTIGVTHGFGTESLLRDAGADYVIDHLEKVLAVVDAHASRAA